MDIVRECTEPAGELLRLIGKLPIHTDRLIAPVIQHQILISKTVQTKLDQLVGHCPGESLSIAASEGIPAVPAHGRKMILFLTVQYFPIVKGIVALFVCQNIRSSLHHRLGIHIIQKSIRKGHPVPEVFIFRLPVDADAGLTVRDTGKGMYLYLNMMCTKIRQNLAQIVHRRIFSSHSEEGGRIHCVCIVKGSPLPSGAVHIQDGIRCSVILVILIRNVILKMGSDLLGSGEILHTGLCSQSAIGKSRKGYLIFINAILHRIGTHHTDGSGSIRSGLYSLVRTVIGAVQQQKTLIP